MVWSLKNISSRHTRDDCFVAFVHHARLWSCSKMTFGTFFGIYDLKSQNTVEMVLVYGSSYVKVWQNSGMSQSQSEFEKCVGGKLSGSSRVC